MRRRGEKEEGIDMRSGGKRFFRRNHLGGTPSASTGRSLVTLVLSFFIITTEKGGVPRVKGEGEKEKEYTTE